MTITKHKACSATLGPANLRRPTIMWLCQERAYNDLDTAERTVTVLAQPGKGFKPAATTNIKMADRVSNITFMEPEWKGYGSCSSGAEPRIYTLQPKHPENEFEQGVFTFRASNFQKGKCLRPLRSTTGPSISARMEPSLAAACRVALSQLPPNLVAGQLRAQR